MWILNSGSSHMPRPTSADTSSPGRIAAGMRRFASPAVRAVLRRRLGEFAGILLCLTALALILMLGSYDPADPSLNTATERAARNLGGQGGAIVADILLQAFGYAAVLPVLCLLAWAWRLATQRGMGVLAARLIGLLAGLPLLAAVFALMPGQAPVDAGAGGAAGPLVLGTAVQAFSALLGPLGGLAAQVILAVLAVALVFMACGLTIGEWRGAGQAALQAGSVAGQAAAGAARAGAEMIHHRAPAPRRPSLLARTRDWFAGLGARRRRPVPDVPLSDMLRAAEQRAGAMAPAPHDPPPPLPGEEEEARRATDHAAAAREASRPRVAARAAETKRAAAAARQPALDLGDSWRMPPLDLLVEPPAKRVGRPTEEALQGNARLLESVLEDYGVRGRIAEIRPGPVVTLYELEPAPGTKASRVIGLADDIARSMSVTAVRIATVPGRNVIGIELPNAKRETVFLSEMFSAEDWARNSGRLPLALGKDIGGAPVIADLARMPHLLIAGTTGSGKSVGINTMILSLLFRFSPDECRFIMIDPKMLELSVYDRIPHLLAPVVTEPPKAIGALKWTVREMERRYRSMSQLGVRNIGGYNEKVTEARRQGEVLTRRVQTGFDPETGKPVFEEQPLALEPLPMIVVVIDEMADLMLVAGKEIEAAVQRLAQMARAAGIHVIMATQRPSVDVITGTIKANFPTRISFQVTSKIDSRTILGEQGAEQLLGQGDMLYMAGGGRVMRVHGPFVTDNEVERVVEYLRSQGEPSYVEEVTETEEEAEGYASGILGGNTDAESSLYDQAVALVTREGKASTSFIQRHLNIGYNRAAKLIEQMEKEGVVGPANHVGKREVLARRSED